MKSGDNLCAFDGRLGDIRPCLGCNQGCSIDRLLRQKAITCTMNASVGQDCDYTQGAAEHPQTVVVIGGGPAGMEAARVAALRGHRVFLYQHERKTLEPANGPVVLEYFDDSWPGDEERAIVYQ